MRRKYFSVELASGERHAKMPCASFPIEGDCKSAAPHRSGYRNQNVCVCNFHIQLNFTVVANEAAYYHVVML